jgi:hypothetical protein
MLEHLMRHKLRQCKVCGLSFVDRAEIAETCFDCHSSELQFVSPPAVGLTSSSVGLSSSSSFVVLGTEAVQLAAPPPDSLPPPQPNPEPIKLWEQKADEVAAPAKREWASPPFRVRFEDHVDSDAAIELSPPRFRMRARSKLILGGAVLLVYFLWPLRPLPTLDDQIALNEPPAAEMAPEDPAVAGQDADIGSPDDAPQPPVEDPPTE